MCCKKTSWVELHFEKKNVCIPRSFLVINVCNQRKTLCSPCITIVYAECGHFKKWIILCLTWNLNTVLLTFLLWILLRLSLYLWRGISQTEGKYIHTHTGGLKKMWQVSWNVDMTLLSFSNSHEYYFCPYCRLDQRFSNCGPRTTSGPRVLPLWSF